MTKAILIRIFFLLVLLHLSITKIYSQSLAWKYAKTGSDANIQLTKIDSSGNVYMAGFFYTPAFEYQQLIVTGVSGSETTNLVIIKTEPTGKPIWMHSIFGSKIGASVGVNKMALNERGEMVVSFTVRNSDYVKIDKFTATTNLNEDNVFVAKFSKTGFLVWIKKIYSSGSTTPAVDLNDLLIDEAGVVYMAGSFTGANIYIGGVPVKGTGDNTMMFLTRIAAKGDVTWARGCEYDTIGMTGNIYANKIALSKSGLICVTGNFNGYRKFFFGNDSTGEDMSTNTFLAGYTLAGVPLWGKFITGSLSEYPEDLDIAKNNDIFLMGYTNSNPVQIVNDSWDISSGNYDLFIAHFSPSGAYINSSVFSTQIPNVPFGKSTIDFDNANNLILCSEFYASTIFSDVSTITNLEPGTSDLAFAKINPVDLKPLWKVHGSGVGNNSLNSNHVDGSGNICMAGTLNSKLTIGGNNIAGDTTYGTPYLVKINQNGAVDFVYQKPNNSANYINVANTVSDAYGNIYMNGSFSGLNTSLGDIPLKRPQNVGFFLGKYGYTRNIGGTVNNSLGDIVNEGYVKIFGYTYFQRSPLNDSVSIEADGTYSFTDIPYGNYIICAFPQREFENEFIPTYFPSEIYWENAQKIDIHEGIVPTQFNIVLVNRTPLTGINGFTGNLQQADSSNLYKSATTVSWKPSQRATVVLASKRKLKSAGDFYAQTETDNEGNFSFNNVNDGTYYLWIEIAGLPSEDYNVNVTGGQFYSSLNFYVNEEYIYKTGSPTLINKAIEEINKNWAYPNPAYSKLMISVNKEDLDANLKVYDIKGSLILKSDLIPGINNLNISMLKAGTYILKLTTNNTVRTKKINILH